VNRLSNYEKGFEFAVKVCRMFNLHFGLTGSKKVMPTPRSGAINGLKGDIMKLPKPIERWCIECKNEEKVSQQLVNWWNQAEDAAYRMAQDPVLIINIPELDEVLVIRRLDESIKGIVGQLPKGKVKGS